MEAQFWINLQTQYNLRQMRFEKEAEMRERIEPFQTISAAEDLAKYNSKK